MDPLWGARARLVGMVLGVGACAVAFATPPAYEDGAQTPAERAAARFDYLLHCSGCHRPDGASAPPDVPSLLGPIGAIVATPAGREYIARVPEVAQSPLDDDALARLLNWVLQEFSAETLPAGFRPLEAAEVGAARTRVLTDPLRTRAAIAGQYAPHSDNTR